MNYSENSETKWLPDGFHFLGPTESFSRRQLINLFQKFLEGKQYSEVILPAMDYSSAFNNLITSQESHSILRFRDLQGKEISPATDLTIQVVKGMAGLSHLSENQKVYYIAKRIKDHKKRNASRREILQVGIERLGVSSNNDINEILSEADDLFRLTNIQVKPTIVLGHNTLIRSILSTLSITEQEKIILTSAIHSKNLTMIQKFCQEKGINQKIEITICSICMQIEFENLIAVLKKLELPLSFSKELLIEELNDVWNRWHASEKFSDLCIDLSIVRDLTYYTGFLFQGYLPGESEPVLSGGQYDKLYEIYGTESKNACGFAIQVEILEEYLK